MANQSSLLTATFHALADPTRRAVVRRLIKGPATVSELAAPFGMALPSFVKHLSVLERSRLIISLKRGRVRTCSLNRASLARAERWFDDLRAQWASRYDNLDRLLTQLKGTNDET